MLTSSVICDVISFFATGKCKKIRKINERREKTPYLLSDFRNFNEIFRKDVANDNIKSS